MRLYVPLESSFISSKFFVSPLLYCYCLLVLIVHYYIVILLLDNQSFPVFFSGDIYLPVCISIDSPVWKIV